ncbi:hypothetical protein HELRODRAFT_143604, partial [Helobdella robusta]|uniref:Protein kinase domain-containing protein n=1 Tax=Helobdella robusta TaxID=6412 RepID=T1EJB0_HELRO
IALHRILRHKNVIQLLYVEQIDQHYVSLMELCDYGNLQQMLRASPGSVLAEPICRRYFRDMLEGVAYLHSQNIVHRDIRCENFLVDHHDCVKLCDLSCATRFCNGDELQTTSYANSAYLSPEIIENKPFNPRTADVWALGVCLHVLLTSKLPF